MDNIIFIGMPAAGKSTIGVVAAKRLGYSFLDVDLLIQEKEKKLLHEIIEERGTEGFLEVEDRINAQVEAEHCIISPGGSVVYCKTPWSTTRGSEKWCTFRCPMRPLKTGSGIPMREELPCGTARRSGSCTRSAESCLKSMRILQFAKMG